MIKPLLYILLLSSLVACASPGTALTSNPGALVTDSPVLPSSPAAATTTATDSDYEGDTITMRRTPCFGTCPVYTVTLNDDGTVEWLGERNVATKGAVTDSADPAAVQSLIQDFLDAGFMEMQDEYTTKCDENGNCRTVSDLPGTVLILTVDGQRKEILNYYGGPEILTALAGQVDEVANSSQWISPPAP